MGKIQAQYEQGSFHTSQGHSLSLTRDLYESVPELGHPPEMGSLGRGSGRVQSHLTALQLPSPSGGKSPDSREDSP